MYCPCCKQYDEMEYDPLETINKFMQFIRGEQTKINPPKKEDRKKKRPKELPDDSLSEITDIEYEEVMHKYYASKVEKISLRKKERAEARKRLQGGTVELKHKCKGPRLLGGNTETVELELR